MVQLLRQLVELLAPVVRVFDGRHELQVAALRSQRQRPVAGDLGVGGGQPQ